MGLSIEQWQSLKRQKDLPMDPAMDEMQSSPQILPDCFLVWSNKEEVEMGVVDGVVLVHARRTILIHNWLSPRVS